MSPTGDRRRLLGSAAAATMAAVIAVGAAVAPAAAEEPTALGWWWAGRPSTTLPSLFSPVPPVPDGGLYVAGDATGPSGISALRFELAPDATATTLTLTIAETFGPPAVDACAAAEPWEPAENGGWEVRAEPDCDTASVTGTVSPDETEVSFALFEFDDRGGVLDLVLVPGVDAEGERPASFSAAFEPPAADALAVSESVDTDDSTAPSPPPSDTAAAEPPPSFATSPPSPPPPSVIEAPAVSETAAPSFAPSEPRAIATRIPRTDDFAYPGVLALPLALLAGGSYLAWALTRPVVVRGIPRP